VSAFFRTLETALLLAPVLPLARLFRIKGFVFGFSGIASALVLLVAGYIAIVVVIALGFPFLLPAMAGLSATGSAAAWWLCRSNYGASRGLPPGSFSLVRSLEAIFDHRFYLKQSLRHGPVFKMMQFNKPVVCVVGLEKGHELIRQPDTILGPAPQPFSADIPGGFLRYMEPEAHAVYALKFRTAFSRNVTAAAEPAMREAIRIELAKMAVDSGSVRGVLPGPYFDRAMFVPFARLIFGFAPGSHELETFLLTCQSFDAQNLAQPLSAETRTALSELRRQILRQIEKLQIEKRKKGNGTDECVLTEWLQANPGLPDQTVLDNFMFLFRIGVNNVSSLLRWILKLLADHPKWAERVRLEGDELERTALAERIVMETLRLEQSEYIYRIVKSPMAIDRYRIPAGWRFRLCVRESHRAAGSFENPESFDPDRFLSGNGGRSAYSPFGTDRHACIAVHSSYAAARILIEELARQYDWKVTNDGPRQRRPRHWHHWEPNSGFSVSLFQRPGVQHFPK
jgi:cytochrome P450